MWNQVQETVNFIKEKTNFYPEYGVILGSGLGSFTNDIKIEEVKTICVGEYFFAKGKIRILPAASAKKNKAKAVAPI